MFLFSALLHTSLHRSYNHNHSFMPGQNKGGPKYKLSNFFIITFVPPSTLYIQHSRHPRTLIWKRYIFEVSYLIYVVTCREIGDRAVLYITWVHRAGRVCICMYMYIRVLLQVHTSILSCKDTHYCMRVSNICIFRDLPLPDISNRSEESYVHIYNRLLDFICFTIS